MAVSWSKLKLVTRKKYYVPHIQGSPTSMLTRERFLINNKSENELFTDDLMVNRRMRLLLGQGISIRNRVVTTIYGIIPLSTVVKHIRARFYALIE